MSFGEQRTAMYEVYIAVKEYGTKIGFITPDESQIQRDAYGSIIQLPAITHYLYAVPIPSPTQKILEKAGLREMCDIIFYLSKLEFNKYYDYATIDLQKWNIVYPITKPDVNNRFQYKIKEKNTVSQFGNDALYVTLGGHRTP